MPRTIPDHPVPEPKPYAPERIRVTLRSVTPVFGGSARKGDVDPQAPVRSASIRGQLRFWWRCLQPLTLSATELHKDEARIFGSAQEVGQVQTDVELHARGQMSLALSYPSGHRKAGPREVYFLFPFRTRNSQAHYLENVSFTLTLTFATSLGQADQAQVLQALKAWIFFGGIGARTRRGCGALQIDSATATKAGETGDTDLHVTDADLKSWFKLPDATQARRNSLSGASLYVIPAHDPMQAWSALGTFWARFRKGHVGSEKYAPENGSYWDDHDTLLAGPTSRAIALNKPYFGLPLKYQNFPKNPSFDGTISAIHNGKKARFTSPVILKPVVLGGQVQSAVLILNGPLPLKIDIQSNMSARGEKDLTAATDDQVLRSLKAGSPLKAVGIAAEQQGYTQVGA